MLRLSQNIQTIIIATTICSFFVVGSYLHATWSGPPLSPPSGNVAVPVNVGPVDQEKEGSLTAEHLIAPGHIWIGQDARVTRNVLVDNEVHSDLYCDRSGDNCFSPNTVSGGDGVACPSRTLGSGDCTYALPSGDAMEVRFSGGDHVRCEGIAVAQCRDGAWSEVYNNLAFDTPDGI